MGVEGAVLNQESQGKLFSKVSLREDPRKEAVQPAVWGRAFQASRPLRTVREAMWKAG